MITRCKLVNNWNRRIALHESYVGILFSQNNSGYKDKSGKYTLGKVLHEEMHQIAGDVKLVNDNMDFLEHNGQQGHIIQGWSRQYCLDGTTQEIITSKVPSHLWLLGKTKEKDDSSFGVINKLWGRKKWTWKWTNYTE